MIKPTIRETIVVEGYHDARAVKEAVEAEIIITSGFGIKEETFTRIAWAQEHGGVIVLTDPDHVGEQIRNRIAARVPEVRHAWISRAEGTKEGDVGVENATAEAILEALEKARCATRTLTTAYTVQDMTRWGLIGTTDAARRRDRLGAVLGIGYGNAKQLLHRLNHYGIEAAVIETALRELET